MLEIVRWNRPRLHQPSIRSRPRVRTMILLQTPQRFGEAGCPTNNPVLTTTTECAGLSCMRTLDQLRVVYLQTQHPVTTTPPASVPWPLSPAYDTSPGPSVDRRDASRTPAAPHSALLPPASHAETDCPVCGCAQSLLVSTSAAKTFRRPPGQRERTSPPERSRWDPTCSTNSTIPLSAGVRKSRECVFVIDS